MKWTKLIILCCMFNLLIKHANSQKLSINDNNITYFFKNTLDDKTIVEKIEKGNMTRILEFPQVTKLTKLLLDDKNIYLCYIDTSENAILKINKNPNIPYEYRELKPPRGYSAWYGTEYHIEKGKIIAKGIGDDDDIYPNKPKTIYYDFIYENDNETWIPKNKNGDFVYEDARSAIRGWVYDGKLKRWYPENNRGEIDKEIWFEQTPTTELRNYPQELWTKNYKGKKINFSEKFKEKIAEERERLKLEEEKRIVEEKQKLQQKIFITLGILFLVTFSGFLIKRLKKKKIIKDHKR